MSDDTESGKRFEAANRLAEYEFEAPKPLAHIEPGNVIEIRYQGGNDPITAIVLDRAFQTEPETGTQDFLLQLMESRPDDHRITATNWDARREFWGDPQIRSAVDDDRDDVGQLDGRPKVLAETPGEYASLEEEFENLDHSPTDWEEDSPLPEDRIKERLNGGAELREAIEAEIPADELSEEEIEQREEMIDDLEREFREEFLSDDEVIDVAGGEIEEENGGDGDE